MSFVAGWIAVAGGVATLLPIAIHLLLRRRRKPIFWPAMALLHQASYRQRQRTRLTQFLLLLLRCLFLFAAGLAISQPILGEATTQVGSRTIHILLDDSAVSGVLDAESKTALSRHIEAITKRIDNNISTSDGVTLTLTAKPTIQLVSEPSNDHRAIKNLLTTLQPRDSASDLTEAIKQVGKNLGVSTTKNEIYLYSDYRSGSIDQNNPPQPLPTNNLSTTELWTTPPTTNTAEDVHIESVFIDRNPATTSKSGLQTRRVTVSLLRTGALPQATYQLDTKIPPSEANELALG